MATPQSDKQAQLEAILEHTAEALGDIVPLVMERFYGKHPEARQTFLDHGFDKVERLEQQMVDSALYCMMLWFEHPAEIKILLAEAVPHHEFLKIPASYFAGLQEAVVEVVDSAIANDDTQAKAITRELKSQLVAQINSASNPQ